MVTLKKKGRKKRKKRKRKKKGKKKRKKRKKKEIREGDRKKEGVSIIIIKIIIIW